jgi:hypothetical protein
MRTPFAVRCCRHGTLVTAAVAPTVAHPSRDVSYRDAVAPYSNATVAAPPEQSEAFEAVFLHCK